MNIIELIGKQNALKDKLDEITRSESLTDEELKSQSSSVENEIEAVEKSIRVAAQEILDEPGLACTAESEEFADAINEAAEKGRSIEEVIFGDDSFIDLTTANCMFTLMRVNGEIRVMGGELMAQSRKYPWLIVKITTDGVEGYPIWEKGENEIERPHLRSGIGCRYHLSGWLQWSMLAFFRRAYARQQQGLPLVEVE